MKGTHFASRLMSGKCLSADAKSKNRTVVASCDSPHSEWRLIGSLLQDSASVDRTSSD